MVAFAAPAVVLVYLSPLTLPVAAGCLVHAWVIPGLYARRGARSVAPIDSSPQGRAERVALGLLGDLLDHRERELLHSSGLAMQRGRLGVWLVGERGAILVAPGGRRVTCWCVRVSDGVELPAGDRVAHLLLAVREDEQGFATVANLAFSGAPWRVRRKLPPGARSALDAARSVASR